PPSNSGMSINKDYYVLNRNNWYYCTSTDRSQYALGVVNVESGGSGYIAYNGSIEAATGIADASVCPYVGKVNGSVMGYTWNGTIGTWASWLN
ncbi:MAG: hypothetical protein WA030_02480, partial [Candidatus Microsaccharimonas sp.]